MNNERVGGKFDQIKGKMKETWGNLTDDEVSYYDGKQDQFFGAVKEKYGIAKDAAEAKINEWSSDLESKTTQNPRNDSAA